MIGYNLVENDLVVLKITGKMKHNFLMVRSNIEKNKDEK
jgi:hypothetical protein